MYSTKDAFLKDISNKSAEELLEQWFSEKAIPYAFGSRDMLNTFFEPIKEEWTKTELLIIAGTAAWRYSLNPSKCFREFCAISDIDVINVSEEHFRQTWENLRCYHRNKWYRISQTEKDELKRHGQDIYCGFASPKWIPDKSNSLRFEFVTSLERYAKNIRFRTVNMMFFRNILEVYDYYRRGIEKAKERI